MTTTQIDNRKDDKLIPAKIDNAIGIPLFIAAIGVSPLSQEIGILISCCYAAFFIFYDEITSALSRRTT